MLWKSTLHLSIYLFTFSMRLSFSLRLTEPGRQQQYSFKIALNLEEKNRNAWKSLLLAVSK